VASHEAIKRMSAGVDTRPNGWFVGVIPRRNPEFVVAVLWEHGDWGANAAKLAAQVATVYVNKKRQQERNAVEPAAAPKPVEMGAVWSEPAPAGRKQPGGRGKTTQTAQLHGGHFLIVPAPLAPARAVASNQFHLPAWLLNWPLRFKEGQP
jgi:penicillin-binding protein 2